MESLPTNPSTEDVLRIGLEALCDARSLIEGIDTMGAADASLKAYLLRIVACLQTLFESAPVGEDETRILACALSTFLPVLDLDWLPAGPDDLPKLTDDDLVTLEALRRERAMQAEKRALKPSTSRWDPLIDLVSESLEVFVVFGYSEGFGRCTELLDAVEAEMVSRSRAPIN